MRSLQLKLPADFGTFTHGEVVDHIASVHIVPLLDLAFLCAIKDGLFAQIATDHENIALLPQSHDRLPNVHLRHFRVQHDLFHDSAQITKVLHACISAPLQCLSHVITGTERECDEFHFTNVDKRFQDLDTPHDATVTAH